MTDDPLTRRTERSTPVFTALADDPASGVRRRHGRIHVDVADELPPWAYELPDVRPLDADERGGFRTGMAVTLPFADMPTYLAYLARRAHDPDDEVAEEILVRATAVEPRLAGARVLGREVGWRPVRPAPRVERDDRGVVHAYGHGGVGVTVSWGVADEVVALVA